MSRIEEAVAAIEQWGPERRSDRKRCLAALRRVGRSMERGLGVWRDFLAKAPPCGDRFTAVLWLGAQRAKRLQRLHLECRDHAAALTEVCGIDFKDSLGFSDELDVVQPYEELAPGETGSDRAQSAIGVMSERLRSIESAISRLESGATN